MSNVTIEIAGRSYTVACADGQESHVLGLGSAIDAKLAAIPNAAAQGEARTLLFAALLLADENHELKQAKTPPPPPVDTLAPALETLAARLENCAAKLEG